MTRNGRSGAAIERFEDGPPAAVLLAHGSLGPVTSKTAASILRYRFQYDPLAILDCDKVGREAREFVGGIGARIPIFGSMEDVLAEGLSPAVMVLGVAPQGGRLPEPWRDDIRQAICAGMDIHNGLHSFLSSDPEFGPLAEEYGARIWDVRRPPADLTISRGEARTAGALVVHTMGTDCSSGKMTTAMELVQEARRRGIRTAFAATGQTGIMIGCDAGVCIDAVPCDFIAGTAKDLVLECDAAGPDLIVVEGQGTLTHPSYSGVTLGLLHGTCPDLVVLCHVAGRTHHRHLEQAPTEFPLANLGRAIEVIHDCAALVHPTRVAAVSLATFALDEAAAREALAAASAQTGLAAWDTVRDGASGLLDAVLAAAATVDKPGAKRCALKLVA